MRFRKGAGKMVRDKEKGEMERKAKDELKLNPE